MIEYERIKSPLGDLLVIAKDDSLIGLEFFGQRNQRLPKEAVKGKIAAKLGVSKWLGSYFSGNQPDFTPKLLLEGTEFQIEVWNRLLKIPYGKVATYGEIAKEIATAHHIDKMSAQAVGNAVGKNPIALIIPCHRVVASHGLGGYSGNIERKIELLKLECYLK